MRDSKLGQPTDRRRLEEKNRGEEMGTGKALRAVDQASGRQSRKEAI